MEVLSRRFRSSRVWCNVVYQEVIAEGQHIHMNSTKWETLSDFVKYLGPSRAKSAPRSFRRALLTPQVNPGSESLRAGKGA